MLIWIVSLFCIVSAQVGVCADVSHHMTVSSYGETKESFETKMLSLVDSANSNFLFRGNLPEKDGKFDYDGLVSAMKAVCEKEGKSLPQTFSLVDLSFLNYVKEHPEIDIEKNWFQANVSKGTFWLNSLYGAEVDPTSLPKSVRDFFLEHHDVDGLKALMQKVRAFIESKNGKATVVYMHCMAGKDRTGAASACYLMQYEGYSYDKAVALDKKVADRDPYSHFMNDIRWYAFYLRDVLNMPTIGKIDGK